MALEYGYGTTGKENPVAECWRFGPAAANGEAGVMVIQFATRIWSVPRPHSL
jgi:hypothetical protein